MITCKELIDFLMGYLDNELAPAVRDEFEAHLRDCEPCHRYLATYPETLRLGKEAHSTIEEAPPERLIQAILAARRKPA